MDQLAVIVAAKSQPALDIICLELVSFDGAALPAFSAGAHIDVHIAPGLTRQYSLCNNPADTHRYQIAILRDPASRGGSRAMHDQVHTGAVLQISAPKNHFPLLPARRSLLFAGGIGVTPILCMAERLAHLGADFEMHYSARSAQRAAFRDRIEASAFAGRVSMHFDDAADGNMDLPALLANPLPDTHLYVCGPGGYIDHVIGTATALGWRPEQLHTEYFAAAAQDTSLDRRFEVMLASSGKTYVVEADRSIVQALAEHGIEIEVSCEQGVCGTCVTRVLEGVPEHRDVYFSDKEKAANDQCTPCCSRSLSKRLVLDL